MVVRYIVLVVLFRVKLLVGVGEGNWCWIFRVLVCVVFRSSSSGSSRGGCGGGFCGFGGV